jgi:chromo domain-containing protein 1
MSLFLPDISQSPVPEEDDDDLSITSTDPGDADSDKDWFVDDVLAERPHSSIPGAKQYLLRWEDFELEDCTWEPVENLGDGLLAQWEEKKAEIEAGTREPFDLSQYEAACLARAERHVRRNAKRRRLGLPLTAPFPSGYIGETPTASTDEQESSESDAEAEEVTEIDPVVFASSRPKPKTVAGVDSGTSTTVSVPSPSVPVASSTATGSTSKSTFAPISVPVPAKAKTGAITTQKVVKQKIFIGIPSPVLQKDTVPSRAPRNDQRPRPSSPLAKPPKTSGTGPSSKPAAPIRKTSGGTLTSYQGTARRSSLFAKSSSSKVPVQGKSTSLQKPSLTINTSVTSSATSACKPTAKRLTATRTRKPPVTAAINVFAGGKQAKKRKNLGDIMADPSKAPKAFSNLRITNIARKRGIEKGDAVGSLASIPAKFLLGDDQNISPRQPSITTPPTVESPSANERPPDSTSAPPTAAPKAQPSTESTERKNVEGARNVKRKKSVRFMGEADTDMPDVIGNLFDDPVDARVSSEGPNDKDKAAAPPRRTSLTSHQEQEWTQVVERPVKFGHSQPLMVKFTGLPQRVDSWFAALQSQNGFDFKCTCTAFHFYSQRFQLIAQGLCRGAIEPVSEQHVAALENVAESLRRSSLALHLVAREYSIIAYPTKCTQWDWIDTGFERNMDITLDGPLRHFIFRSADTLLPRAYPSTFFHDSEAFDQLIRPNGLNDPEIVGILTKLDFNKLQPQELKLNGKQVYMLLIPLKARQLIRVMKAWLRKFSREHGIHSIPV